jgi:hypothetical protein
MTRHRPDPKLAARVFRSANVELLNETRAEVIDLNVYPVTGYVGTGRGFPFHSATRRGLNEMNETFAGVCGALSCVRFPDDAV